MPASASTELTGRPEQGMWYVASLYVGRILEPASKGQAMIRGVQMPRQVRVMSKREYQIVSRVFGSTLPGRYRILITDGAGVNGRAFVVPTSLLWLVFGVNPIILLPSLLAGYLGSLVNAGYLMNVGQYYNDLSTKHQGLLVHETTHVWQGTNSIFALSYVFSSVRNQALYGRRAYDYVAGQPWASYNAEQQASIVEDWFVNGQPASGPLYPYIVDHVRKGDV